MPWHSAGRTQQRRIGRHRTVKHVYRARTLRARRASAHICSEVSVFTTREQVASAGTEVLDAGHRKALCRIAIYVWVKNRVAIALRAIPQVPASQPRSASNLWRTASTGYV